MLVALAAWTSPVGGQSDSALSVQLTLLDGASQRAQLTGIDNGVLRGKDIDANLALDDLQRIVRTGATVEPLAEPTTTIELFGGRLLVSKLVLADEKCVVTWLGGAKTTIPLDGVKAIRFDTTASPEFAKALATPSAEHDQVFLHDDAGAITSVAGLIESLDVQRLKVAIAGQVREVPRARLYGLVIAQPPSAARPHPFTLTLNEGSKLAGEVLVLQSGQVRLNVPKAGDIDFPWSAVVSIEIRSSRVQYLSELKPIAENQQPIVTLALPAQRDRTAAGGPLVLGRRTYEKGLGVHALSQLTFAADAKWDQFAATIGLDPERGNKGDCVFKVLADGDELFSQRFTAADPPAEVQLNITGRQKLTLLVEPGEALDLADHANWCDARLIKDK